MANNQPLAKQISFRRSQSFALGSGMNAPPAAAHVLNLQAARNLVLGRLLVEPGVPATAAADAVNGDVTAITVQGASFDGLKPASRTSLLSPTIGRKQPVYRLSNSNGWSSSSSGG